MYPINLNNSVVFLRDLLAIFVNNSTQTLGDGCHQIPAKILVAVNLFPGTDYCLPQFSVVLAGCLSHFVLNNPPDIFNGPYICHFWSLNSWIYPCFKSLADRKFRLCGLKPHHLRRYQSLLNIFCSQLGRPSL